MTNIVSEFISRRDFVRAYWLLRDVRYREFLDHIERQLKPLMDAESELCALKIRNCGRNTLYNVGAALGCSIGAVLDGTLARRDETLKVTGEALWITRRKFFRGTFYLHREPKSDTQYFAEARSHFYAGRYSEFLRVSRYIADTYQTSRAFRKMQQIAERRQNV